MNRVFVVQFHNSECEDSDDLHITESFESAKKVFDERFGYMEKAGAEVLEYVEADYDERLDAWYGLFRFLNADETVYSGKLYDYQPYP